VDPRVAMESNPTACHPDNLEFQSRLASPKLAEERYTSSRSRSAADGSLRFFESELSCRRALGECDGVCDFVSIHRRYNIGVCLVQLGLLASAAAFSVD
jgi:hypothetical protein